MSSILTNFFYRKSYKKLENNLFKNWYKTDIFASKCCQVKSKWQISFEQLSFQRQQFNLPRVCNKNEAIFMRSNHARVSWELKYTIFENSQKKVSFDFDFFLIFPFDNSRFFRHFLLIKKSPKWDIFQWFSYPVKLWMVVVDEIPSITWPWPKETFFIRFSYNPLNFYDLWFFSEGFFIYRVLPTSLRSTIYWKNTISASCRDYNKNQIFSWLMVLELWKNFSHEILIKKIENKRAKRAVILSVKKSRKKFDSEFLRFLFIWIFLVIFKHCALYPFW